MNTTNGTIRCFAPPLLALSFAVHRDAATPDVVALQAAIQGSGLLDATDAETPAAAERARRAGSTLVRDARFSRRVIHAYEGRCAMCGLGIGLVQGAHIYPASAPGSQDEPWNGLALCANHHLAFDRHLIAVHPGNLVILFRDDVLEQANESDAVHALVHSTYHYLATPADGSVAPRPQMLKQRYQHFIDHYAWLDHVKST